MILLELCYGAFISLIFFDSNLLPPRIMTIGRHAAMNSASETPRLAYIDVPTVVSAAALPAIALHKNKIPAKLASTCHYIKELAKIEWAMNVLPPSITNMTNIDDDKRHAYAMAATIHVDSGEATVRDVYDALLKPL